MSDNPAPLSVDDRWPKRQRVAVDWTPPIKCQNADACRCTHEGCTAGWLDEDKIVIRNGRKYQAAVRCPVCADAIPEPPAPRIRRRRDRGAGELLLVAAVLGWLTVLLLAMLNYA